MKYFVKVQDRAEADMTNAALWNRQQRPELGDEFLAEVNVAISNAAENPFRFPCLRRKPEIRRVLTNRFPFRVFFIRQKDAIVVFRVLHGARHDREWKFSIPVD